MLIAYVAAVAVAAATSFLLYGHGSSISWIDVFNLLTNWLDDCIQLHSTFLILYHNYSSKRIQLIWLITAETQILWPYSYSKYCHCSGNLYNQTYGKRSTAVWQLFNWFLFLSDVTTFLFSSICHQYKKKPKLVDKMLVSQIKCFQFDFMLWSFWWNGFWCMSNKFLIWKKKTIFNNWKMNFSRTFTFVHTSSIFYVHNFNQIQMQSREK